MDTGRGYEPLARRPASRNEATPAGMIIHAVIAAALRQPGRLRPAPSTTTLAPARAQCPMTPAFIHRRPGAGVSQLPITIANSSATTSRPDAVNASVHGGQMVHGRHVWPGRAASCFLMSPVSSASGSADMSTSTHRSVNYAKTPWLLQIRQQNEPRAPVTAEADEAQGGLVG